ncbi:hypothetical protein BGZ80_003953 [Entomortierella chlamydospora]|uniref:Uncharacterized protein n=1 Tax=Entomortierella chlamydospora TaxID=101097 RepID=A0A9P6N1P8_9FUNG|nr:hypothetical protein BGZ80_003953 [Entomortierella chlamydospora]
MIRRLFSSTSSSLSLDDALKLANEQLQNARDAKNKPPEALEYSDNAKSNIKKAERIFAANRAGSASQDDGIASAYHEHATLLDALGYNDKAQKSHSRAEKWGYVYLPVQKNEQSLSPLTTISTAAAIEEDISNLDIAQPIAQSHTQKTISDIKDHTLGEGVDTPQLPRQIFSQDTIVPSAKYTLPENNGLITSTPQLAYCLSLSLPSLVSKESLSEAEYEWSQARIDDSEEQGRLKSMATDVIRAFVRSELKNPAVVAEVVCLAAVLDPVDFRKLLQKIVDGIDQSVLLRIHLLDGLAQMMRDAQPGYVDTDDLVKVLELLNRRLKGTHQQSIQNIHRLTYAVSRVLDSMVDSQVKDLKREELHEPLSEYLKHLQESSDPSLVYQAAYAYQALQYIPDDESILQVTFRRTGKVVRGISGGVSAVRALDFNGFIDGLKGIQGGLEGAAEAIGFVREAYNNVKDLAESGQVLLESLKEGLSFSRKSAWYPALRCLDTLLQEGRLAEFEKLIREAPCRQDLAFQWGVCQRLGELAANPLWGINIRQSAISLLGEMHKDNTTWSLQVNVKQWIYCILDQLTSSSDTFVAGHAQECLLELQGNGDKTESYPTKVDTKEYSYPYPLISDLPPQTSPLLNYVLDKPDVEAPLKRLRAARLKEQDRDVYISPRAKANFKATEDFDLAPKVEEFLANSKKVLLLLGDSGSGKSTFNRALETSLWENYKKSDDRIPLFVHLPTIDKPEHDLIAKQLRKLDFTEREINELRVHREFILICDGYDESQQTRNLYMSNHLNQSGSWKVQMLIGCRTEYIGVDYKDCFQPTDGDNRRRPELFQETVIVPFNKDQIHDYINQYVSLRKPSWESKDYERALKEVPNLQDLVKNPFLLKLALEVLPHLVEKDGDLTTTRITRIGLYDEFLAQWLERGKMRLTEMELNPYDDEAFKTLYQLGFSEHATAFLRDFSAAIYDNQKGNPVVSRPELRDGAAWKQEFFNRRDGNNLLLESLPLICNSAHYRFIHKSALEYGLTLAIFDPKAQENHVEPTTAPSRRGSIGSALSFEIQSLSEKDEAMSETEQPLLKSPLGRRNFVGDPSILLFLVERAQQEPAFRDQLHAAIQRSKVDKTARIAAANAITVLVKANVQFNGADLRNIKIPGADLSFGVFDSAQLQGADLRKANLHSVWLRKANLKGARMSGVQLDELPSLQHIYVVDCCTYSPDGEMFAVGIQNGDIVLYNTSSWERVRELSGHTMGFHSLSFSAKGDRIISGNGDGTARLWDVKTSDCIHTLKHDSRVICAVYSPKEDRIVSGSWDKTIKVWDVETGNCIQTLQGHAKTINCVAHSPKGSQIASGSWDKTVRLWDAEAGNCILTLQGHTTSVSVVTYSPNGDQVASGSEDKTVRLWDVKTGDCVNTLQGHAGEILKIVYSSKGDCIVSGSRDGALRLWDVVTGTCVHQLQGHVGPIYCIVYSPKGDQIASGSGDKTVRLWDVETGDCIQTFQGHNRHITCVAYSPKGDQIASGSWDRRVRLWDVKSSEYVLAIPGHGREVDTIVYLPKEGKIVSGSQDMTVRLWDAETGDCIYTLQGHDSKVGSVAYSPKGGQFASGSDDGTVRLWNVETGKCVRVFQDHCMGVTSVAYSPNGEHIASGRNNLSVKIWDIETGDCVKTLQGHDKKVNSVAYSPKGDQIASGSDDDTIRLWDVETGACVSTLRGHKLRVFAAVYSPKGDQIASTSMDETIRLWSVESGECVRVISGPDIGATNTVYSPKGDQIVTGNEKVQLWSVETGECQLTITGFNGSVWGVAWEDALNCQYIITGCRDKSVRRWQITKERDEYKALLCWSSSHDVLTTVDASFDDVEGLTDLNWMILRQYGALKNSITAS